jgi:thymidylate synthase (FAD)
VEAMNIELRSDVKVSLIDFMGNDTSVIAAAKVSTAGAESLEELDKDGTTKSGLIDFLMKNRHGTPFEHNAMTFFVQAPIMVFREFHRHRIGWSYNEESGRYKQLEPVFYVPGPERNMVQKGKPGEYRYENDEDVHAAAWPVLQNSYSLSYREYERLLSIGVAREVARAVLPVSIFSSMYATCNARSLMAFLSLRTKREDSMFPSFPMREIEMVADKMEQSFAFQFPVTWAAFNEQLPDEGN